MKRWQTLCTSAEHCYARTPPVACGRVRVYLGCAVMCLCSIGIVVCAVQED